MTVPVTKIYASEGAPRYSAFDPCCPTSFGKISFEVFGCQIDCPTTDRSSDYIGINGQPPVRCSNDDRVKLNGLISSLWSKQELSVDETDLPAALLALKPC